MKLVGKKFNNTRLDIELYVFNIDGENWFLGTETATILGYQNPSDAVYKKIWNENKMKVYVHTIENIGHMQNAYVEINSMKTIIKEAGLYQLIFSSKLKEAIIFQQWVFNEVLPSLRENNYYIDEDYISKEQINRMREHLYFLCSEGKMSLGKASMAIFGDKKTLKKKLIERGWLDYENNTFQQQRMLNKDNEYFDLFVVSKVGSYENGNTKTQMQVSISNAGVVWLREKFRNA